MDEISQEFNRFVAPAGLDLQFKGVIVGKKVDTWRAIFSAQTTLEGCLETFATQMSAHQQYARNMNTYLYGKILDAIREQVTRHGNALTKEEEKNFWQSRKDVRSGLDTPVDCACELYFNCFPDQYLLWETRQITNKKRQ